MHFKMIFPSLLPIFAVIRQVSSSCMAGTFLNICGYCVDIHSDRDEMYGLDRCMVCGGNSSCVGCDGIVNSNYKTDACGMCLPKNDPKWNDCLVITRIYPDVVDRALGNNVVALSLIGAGLSAENQGLAKGSCEIAALQGQGTSPRILELGLEEADLELKVEVGESNGVYKISCVGVEGMATLRVANSLGWNVTRVEPDVISVDENSELMITVNGDQVGEGPVWCFLRCSGATKRINAGKWLEKNRVKCSMLNLRQAADCHVGVSATEEAAIDETSTGGVFKFVIKSNSPSIISAELNSDLGKLLLRFNANIQLTSSCDGIFLDASKVSLIMSRCIVSGDILAVGLQPEHPLLSHVEIIAGNGIRRMGNVDPDLSPECKPIVVPVSTQKVLPPNLSLLVPSVLCFKSEELKVASIGNQRLNYIWSMPPPAVHPGTQRENLLLWEKSRHLEKNLNKLHSDSAHLEANELLADARYSIHVRGTNALGEEQSVSSALTFSPSAPITVTVNALPAVTAILAELNVTQCAPLPGGLAFRWFLNGVPVSGGGRMVLMPNLKPGSYNVTCLVMLYKTSEILAAGWAMTQVLPSEEKALLSPAKQIVGTMDTVIIRAFTPYNVPGIWYCVGENEMPCVSPGVDGSHVDAIVDNNVTILTIPPGKLAVGSYTWRLKNMAGTEAEVVVIPGTPPALTASLITPLVNPSTDLQLNGDARRLHVDCTLQWSTVFRVGFNYFNLQEDIGLGDTLRILPDDPPTAELSLTVPTAQGHWGGLMAEAAYLLRFTAACPADAVGTAYVDVPITVNVPPTVGAFQVSPSEGIALQTEFLVTGGEARDVFHDYPIQYVWSLKDGSDVIPLYSGSTARSLQFLLPPGKIEISLEVCDIHGTCSDVSSPVIAVDAPISVSDAVIKKLQKEISESILEGSTVIGLGKAVVAVKTLTSVAKSQQQLQDVLDTTDDAISTRARDLKLDMVSDFKASVTSLEFLRHVLDCMRYLKPSQLTLDLIVDLKDAVAHTAMSRTKRNARKYDPVEGLNAEDAVTLLEVPVNVFFQYPTKEHRQKLLDDVREMMGSYCGTQEIRVESKYVDLWISAKITPNDFEKNLGPANTKVRLNSRRNVCLAIAAFSTEIFTSNDLNLLSKVYDVQLVNSDKTLVRATSKDPTSDITIPVKTGEKKSHCHMWDGNQWIEVKSAWNRHGQIVCTTREFGYFGVIGDGPPATIPTTLVETTLKTTSIPEIVTESSTMRSVVTVSTSTPATTTAALPETTVMDPVTVPDPALIVTPKNEETTDSGNGNEKIVKATAAAVSFDGVQFKIEEDFETVVAGDRPSFQNEVTRQIADLLDVKSEDIRVFVEKGSILVRVYFLVSMNNDHAFDVVNQLTRYVQDGKLELTAQGRILHVPPQNVSYLILPDSGNAATIRMATFITVGIMVLFVALVICISARKEPRHEFVSRGLHMDDSAPCYLNFDNDPSLEGSSASLAKYRRPFALNLEPAN